MFKHDVVISEILSNKYCRNCILLNSFEHIKARNETLKLNIKYVPKQIKVLLIAESPPESFIRDKHAYFYANPQGKIAYGSLGYYIASALFKDKFPTKQAFFQKLMANGIYFIDAVKRPINKLSKADKAKAIKSCSTILNAEVHSLRFNKAVFIGKNSFKAVRRHIVLDFNYTVIPLPFRSLKNVEGFREGLIKAVGFHEI